MTAATPGSAELPHSTIRLLALAKKLEGPQCLVSADDRAIAAAACRLAAKPAEEMREAKPQTCLDATGLKITGELYKAVSEHTGDACLLAMIGSWGDTLDDLDILAGLHRYNEMGECFIPDVLSTTGQPKP